MPASSESFTASEPSFTAPVERVVWRPVLAPRGAAVARPVRGKVVAIVGGTDADADAVARELVARGATSVRFEGAASVANYRVDGAIDLNVPGPFALDDGDGWRRAVARTFDFLKAVYGDWSRETDARRIFYTAVTRMGGRMGYDAAPGGQPLGGFWAGLAKTLPREIANLSVRVVDVPADAPLDAAALVREIEHGDGLFEVGLRGAERCTLTPRREPVPSPSVRLDASDTVLVSGGGRGIGFEFALHLSRRTGCRVIVTGRASPLPPTDPRVTLSDDEFRAYRANELRGYTAERALPAIRAALDETARLRELGRNLARARAAGANLEYRVCDVADASSLATLLREIGAGLTGVVHNAGVDTPARLDAKSVDDAFRTIAVKVDGFRHLAAALPYDQLKFFCNVGSLTGRSGGMVGQLDYAGANEALSRLGLWLAGRMSAPVKTLCWPTWDRIGMISNFRATLRYMAALDVDAGLEHWLNEILSGGSGEVTFMGPVGSWISPVILRGFLPSADVPSIERLRGVGFWLGEVQEYEPERVIRSRFVLREDAGPCLQDFTVAGRAALPVSVLLELGWSLSSWVLPPDRREETPRELGNVSIDCRALCFDDDRCSRIEVEARASGTARERRVELAFRRVDGDVFARAVVAASHSERRSAVELRTEEGPPSLSWRGLVFPRAGWSPSGGAFEVCSPGSLDGSDLWMSSLAPPPELPLAAIEAVLQRLAQGNAAVLEIGRLRTERLPAGAALCFTPSTGVAYWKNAEHREVLLCEGIRLTQAPAARLAPARSNGLAHGDRAGMSRANGAAEGGRGLAGH